MASGAIERPSEFRALLEFLASMDVSRLGSSSTARPVSARRRCGWPGSPKHAIAASGCSRRACGQAETMLAYAAVADLLRDVEPTVLDGLPELQRLAVDRVLLRASAEGPATDQERRCGGIRGGVDRLTGTHRCCWPSTTFSGWTRPVRRSLRVRGTTVRRIGSACCSPSAQSTRAQAQLVGCSSRGLIRSGGIRVGPLSLGGLHALISARLGAVAAPPDDGAHRRDLRRQPVLRPRTRAGDRAGVAGTSFGAAGDVGRADAAADRTA